MWMETVTAAGFICQHGHTLPAAAEAAATPLSRQRSPPQKWDLIIEEQRMLKFTARLSTRMLNLCRSLWLGVTLGGIVKRRHKTPLTFGGQPAIKAQKRDWKRKGRAAEFQINISFFSLSTRFRRSINNKPIRAIGPCICTEVIYYSAATSPLMQFHLDGF